MVRDRCLTKYTAVIVSFISVSKRATSENHKKQNIPPEVVGGFVSAKVRNVLDPPRIPRKLPAGIRVV